ncbi:cytochrome C oxidase subunit IV family protein [Hyalangium sp.]|uniref:cytochrome C oxidase subunit IV family protein n=1 Tax=Hyalangium sp. TaxID=2028555 RepID=UPI002D2F9E0D|nr:cytochrome C oxidase subunit IV family protein [Hyalangium sp.]HYH96488.1 cytochrome C oxidase subunit IV family protein [Hyalangium sp.]
MSVANESSQEAHNMQEHHSSVRYWVVWGVLLALTGLTVWTGSIHIPQFGLALALLIASAKGGLVLLFFMHLVDHKGANRLVMAVSVLFVLMMLIMPMADLATRYRPANPAGSHLSDLPDLEFIEGKKSTHNRAGGGAHGSGQAAPGGQQAPSPSHP